MDNAYNIGMAELIVINVPAKLVTLGLGSCVGLVLYDSIAKVAGMVHIMLPDSRGANTAEKPGKFADSAVPTLLDEMIKKGASKSRIKAKLAGGAQMFNLPGVQTDFLSVGARNVKETMDLLAKKSIPIVASDTGGNKGRTIEFSTSNWMLSVKTLGKGTSEI